MTTTNITKRKQLCDKTRKINFKIFLTLIMFFGLFIEPVSAQSTQLKVSPYEPTAKEPGNTYLKFEFESPFKITKIEVYDKDGRGLLVINNAGKGPFFWNF